MADGINITWQLRDSVFAAKPQMLLRVNTFLTGIKLDIAARDVAVPSQANTVLVGARIAIRIG